MKKLLISSAFILIGFMSQTSYSYNHCFEGTATNICEQSCKGIVTNDLQCNPGLTACSCPGGMPSRNTCMPGTDSIRTCQQDSCRGIVTTDLKCPSGETACSCQ